MDQEFISVLLVIGGFLIAYFLLVWFVRRTLIKYQINCVLYGGIIALLLAPSLLISGGHDLLPLPAFAWMVMLWNTYNCLQNDIFCSIQLNLFLVVLPFIATWVFTTSLCKDKRAQAGSDSESS